MDRRRFLTGMGSALLGASGADATHRLQPVTSTAAGMAKDSKVNVAQRTTLFLRGDVMTGRGIDQILPRPSRPELHEPYVHSALRYVELAEEATGPIARPVDFAYIWGDALAVLDRLRPDARIVNLETAITASEDAWPGKGINYRMHPANIDCLSVASINCCSLANNHVLDWGYRGLAETLATLRAAGICTAGAGDNEGEACEPAIIDVAGGRRVIVFACGLNSAGVPREWSAGKSRAGICYLPDLTASSAESVAARVSAVKRSGDIAVASIHWGGNWGYGVARSQRRFAHLLVDDAGIDVVHGHSSHHPKGIEIYRSRPILYGCGDFLNDYEGIAGNEGFRSELGLMYFPKFGANGALEDLTLVPSRLRHFRVNRAGDDEAAWLAAVLTREGRDLATRVERRPDGTLVVYPRQR